MPLIVLKYNIFDPNSSFVDQTPLNYVGTENIVYNEYAYNPIYDTKNNLIGNATFVDLLNNINGVQYLNETATYYFKDGSITYQVTNENTGVFFNKNVYAKILYGTGQYFSAIGKIAIDVYENGDRTVWINYVNY